MGEVTGKRRGSSADDERQQLAELWDTLRRTSPTATRRDVLRGSAVAAGAVATARFGATAGAAPAARTNERRLQQDEPIASDATIRVPFNPYGQPVTLDPHRTVNWGPFWVMFPNVWSGLVRYDENGRVVLDLAESYDLSDDGLTYSFKIRADARYASGNQVVAEDFIRSWRRALNPRRVSPMATFMQHVLGYEKYITRRDDDLGFKANGDDTIEVTLSRPANYFLSYMASFVWAVVDPAVLKEAGDDEFMLRDAGAGPWRFTEFNPDELIVMEPNENYYGGTSPSIVKIEWPIVTGPTADSEALNLYKQDEVVSADVPLSLQSGVERDEELVDELITIEPYGTTVSLAMDFNQPPFNDVRVRRAFAQAIDRERWANEIWEGTWAPTTSFTPPVVRELSGYEPPEGLGFDADAARGLLEEAGFPNGEGLPEITFVPLADIADDEKARWQRLLDMIRENLGLEVLYNQEQSVDDALDLRADNGGLQLAAITWQNIYETPRLLSEVFASEAPTMRGFFNWNGEIEPIGDFDPGADARAFDELVAKADVEQDAETRNDLYRQAEELVLRNAVYIPLGNWKQRFVQKPWLRGTKHGPMTGRLPVLFDRDVVVVER